VYHFMKENPCIVIGQDKAPYLLVTVDAIENIDQNRKDKLRKKFETPGLRGILLRSMADLTEQSTASIVKVDPKTSILF